MNKNTENKTKLGSFIENLPADFTFPSDAVGRRLLKEYGAVFVAGGGVCAPKTVIFKNEAEVSKFQASLLQSKEKIGDFDVELQTAAMTNLKEAIAEAEKSNLKITPRGADAARRNYAETVELWASRVNPGLIFWVGKGKLTEPKASKIRALSPFEQVAEIFKLETEQIFFSKDTLKSIVYSVAPPGASQHLSMLALDVNEHADLKVRGILARHFWYQTVVSDLPHFTFLGAPEIRLSSLGLKRVSDGGRVFWLPDL